MNSGYDNNTMIKDLESEDNIRREIINDFSHNILVEAGAGSGKTTIMVERILNQVITQGTDPEKIVAITFTEKAANELKERFQTRLLERYSSERKNDEEGQSDICKRLKKAIDSIDKIQISTIHSFCSRMLREMPFEAGLGMELTIVQDAEEKKMKEKLFSEFCESDMTAVDPQIEKLKAQLRNVNINPEALVAPFAEICDKSDVEWVYEKNLSALNYNSIYKKADGYAAQIMKLLLLQPGSTDGFTAEQLKNGGSFAATEDPVIKDKTCDFCRMYQASGSKELDKLMKALSDIDKNPCAARKDKNKNYNSAMFEVGKKVNENYIAAKLEDMIKNLNVEYQKFRHSLCMSYLEYAIAYYQSVKHKEKKLTNDDLLLYACNMIYNSKTAREFFKRKYESFYVDEFQDTNPIQTQLLFYLSAAEDKSNAGGLPKDWLQCKLEDGRIFMVGDPKQSIYSFTGADITLYSRVRDKLTLEDNGIVYKLKANYRSNRRVCNWIQSTFTKSSSNKDYGFPTISDPAEAGQAVFEGIITPAPDEKPAENMLKGIYSYDLGIATKDEMIAKDAAFISGLIMKAIESKVQISMYNAKAKKTLTRAVSYGDFLIITWNTTSMTAYIKAMKDRGIPISVSGKIESKTLEEVQNLSLLLNFLENYNSSYLLATVLEQIFGCHYEADERFKFNSIVWNEEKINEIEDERLKKALLRLHRLLKLRIFEPPMVVVEHIVNDFKLISGSKKYDYITLSVAMGNVEQMLEIIRSEQYSNLSDIALRLDALVNDKLDREMSITDLVDERGEYNAVRIMNLHKAKGLEGNIVILADPATKADAKDDKIIYTEEHGQKKGYVKIVSDRNEIYGQPDGWSTINDINKKLKIQELVRLNYVACTRAKEALIVSSGQAMTANGRKIEQRSWTDFVGQIVIDDEMKKACGALLDCSAMTEDTNAATEDKPTDNSEEWKIIDTKEQADILLQENRIKIDAANEPLSITIHPSSQFNYVARSKEQSATSRFRGNLYGIIVHRLFQLLVEERDSESAVRIKKAIHTGLESEALTIKQCRNLNLDEEVSKESLAVQKQILFDTLYENLEDISNSFLNNMPMQELLKNADAVYTELPFWIRMEGRMAEAFAEAENLKSRKVGKHIYVSGIMDLVVVKGNHYTIIDYKTNAKGDDEDTAAFIKDLYLHYQPQLDLYEKAIRTIAGEAVTVEKRLYSLYD